MNSRKQPELIAFKTEEGEYMTRLTRKFSERDVWEEPKPSEVHSYIPGMVVKFFVKEGDRLNAGDPILTFEAMKMENTLTMPYTGVIRKLNVKVGDVFAKDIVLAEIELE